MSLERDFPDTGRNQGVCRDRHPKHANGAKVMEDASGRIVTIYMVLRRKVAWINLSVKGVKMFGKTKTAWWSTALITWYYSSA